MGSGKSVLARQVVDALAKTNVICAEHSCEAGDTSTIAIGALLDSWSTRLCQQLPGFHEDLARTAGVHITGTASGPGSTGVKLDDVRIAIGDESPADAFLRTVARPLERLAANGRLPRTVLIVDGVEEAREADGRNRILTRPAGHAPPRRPPRHPHRRGVLRALCARRPAITCADARSVAARLASGGVG